MNSITTVPAILKYLSENKNYNIEDQNVEFRQRAKKRRLDHLSWEEKMQRKKLKNRVAAQTSRDRKKAKMDQMESAIEELFTKNEALISEVENLKAINERLTSENHSLRNNAVPCSNCAQNRSVECESMSGSAESLLQPKGMPTHSAAILHTSSATAALLKIVVACLLYRTSLTSSTTTSTSIRSNSSLSPSSRISPKIWRRLLQRQIFKNQSLLEKWWGRHQNNWNPMELMCK